jgi:putative PIN family toxin of toxin-antitoxin system
MAQPGSTRSQRLLLDTNVVVGALLWRGPPWRLLEQALEDGVELLSSPVLLAELRHTLEYAKFTRRLALLGTDTSTLMRGYERIVTLVEPEEVLRVVSGDADDDHVIAAAVAGQVDAIISGDKHLLTIGNHGGIAIVGVQEGLARLVQR